MSVDECKQRVVEAAQVWYARNKDKDQPCPYLRKLLATVFDLNWALDNQDNETKD